MYIHTATVTICLSTCRCCHKADHLGEFVIALLTLCHHHFFICTSSYTGTCLVGMFVVSCLVLVTVAQATFFEQVILADGDVCSAFPTLSYVTFFEQATLAGASSRKACKEISEVMQSLPVIHIFQKLHAHLCLVNETKILLLHTHVLKQKKH